MIPSKKAIDIIKEFEGFRSKPYLDCGNTAIGYGHTLHTGAPNESDSKIVWDEQHASTMLELDTIKVAQELDKIVKALLSQGQFDALVSWCYNLGIGSAKQSSWLKELNAGNYNKVPECMKLWNKMRDKNGKLVEAAGLTRRRKAEAEMFETSMIKDTMQ